MTRECASVLVCKIKSLDFFAVSLGNDGHLRSVAVGAVAGYKERVVFAVVCKSLMCHTVRKSRYDERFFGVFVILAYGNTEISSDSEEQNENQPHKAAKNDNDGFAGFLPFCQCFFLRHNACPFCVFFCFLSLYTIGNMGIIALLTRTVNLFQKADANAVKNETWRHRLHISH